MNYRFKKIITCIFIIIGFPLSAMQVSHSQTIKITTSQASYDISLQVALQSQTIAHLIQDSYGMTAQNIVIPLPDIISPKTMAMAAQVMTSFYDHRNLIGKALLDAVEYDLSSIHSRMLEATRTFIYYIWNNEISIYLAHQKEDMVNLLRAFDFFDFNLGLQFAGRWIAKAMINDPKFEEEIVNSGSSLSPYATLEIARFYSLFNETEAKSSLQEKRNTWNIGRSPLPGFEDQDYGYSIRDYLDYTSDFFLQVLKAVKGKMAFRALWSLDGLQLIPGILSVKRLDLSFNRLDSLLDINTFLGFNNLEILDLHANDLETIDPVVFSPLINLRILDLRGNNLSEINKKQLHDALPKVDISY